MTLGDLLKDMSPAFRVATEAYQLAVALDAPEPLQVALWAIVEREMQPAAGEG